MDEKKRKNMKMKVMMMKLKGQEEEKEYEDKDEDDLEADLLSGNSGSPERSTCTTGGSCVPASVPTPCRACKVFR